MRTVFSAEIGYRSQHLYDLEETAEREVAISTDMVNIKDGEAGVGICSSESQSRWKRADIGALAWNLK